MEKEEESIPKKETGCLFYNFSTGNNLAPISTEINRRNKKIKNMCSEMNSEIEKYDSKDKYMKNNIKFYNLFWSQFFFPKVNKPPNKKTKITKKRNSLNSKIYFGSFFNQNSQFDGTENVMKYEKLKNIISKSCNFSFLKKPKSIKISKIPSNFNLSKSNNATMKELISFKKNHTENNINNNDNLINKNLKHDGYIDDNNLYKNINSENDDEYIEIKEELKKKIDKIKNNNAIYIKNGKNRNSSHIYLKKFNSKNNSPNLILSPLTKNNSFDFIKTEEKEELDASKNISKKNKSYSKLNTNIFLNLENTNNSYSNIYNKTYNQNFHFIQKNPLYTEIKDKLNRITKYKTPKKDIKKSSNYSKLKCQNKIRKIDKLIRKTTEFKSDPKSLMRLLKENKNKVNKKRARNKFYYDMRNQLRLLSLVDNLKNIKENAPLSLMKQLKKDYYEKSKEMIVDDKTTKKINNIYRSSDQGKVINEKVSGKSYYIDKFISSNHMEGVKLKNKYEKFDMVLKEIIEENDLKKNYKMIAWINKIKQLQKKE